MHTRTDSDTVLLPPAVVEWSAECALARSAAAPARIRARTVLTVLGWRGDIDDAVLVVSELVSNAALHARVAGRVSWLRLAVLADGDLLVEVTDPLAGFVPATGPGAGSGTDAPAEEHGEHGRGLRLVSALGELTWFPRAEHGGGKTVRVRMRPGAGTG